MAILQMGYTPLHWAAYSGSVKTVQKLLEYGADGSRTDKVFCSKFPHRLMYLHVFIDT